VGSGGAETGVNMKFFQGGISQRREKLVEDNLNGGSWRKEQDEKTLNLSKKKGVSQ